MHMTIDLLMDVVSAAVPRARAACHCHVSGMRPIKEVLV